MSRLTESLLRFRGTGSALGPLALVLLAACPSEDPGPKLVPLPPAAVARPVAKEGPGALARGGPTVPGAVGALLENDVLDTEEKSKALVRAPGGREIELGEKTH